MKMKADAILSTIDVAIRLGVTSQQVRQWVWEDRLPNRALFGPTFLFFERDVQALEADLKAALL